MGININDNFLVKTPKSLDDRFGPHRTIDDAHLSIPLAYRYNGLMFGVYDTPRDLANSKITVYYYYGDLSDDKYTTLLSKVELDGIEDLFDNDKISQKYLPDLTSDDESITIDENTIFRVNTNGWDLSNYFNNKLNF